MKAGESPEDCCDGKRVTGGVCWAPKRPGHNTCIKHKDQDGCKPHRVRVDNVEW